MKKIYLDSIDYMSESYENDKDDYSGWKDIINTHKSKFAGKSENEIKKILKAGKGALGTALINVEPRANSIEEIVEYIIKKGFNK